MSGGCPICEEFEAQVEHSLKHSKTPAKTRRDASDDALAEATSAGLLAQALVRAATAPAGPGAKAAPPPALVAGGAVPLTVVRRTQLTRPCGRVFATPLRPPPTLAISASATRRRSERPPRRWESRTGTSTRPPDTTRATFPFARPRA